MAAPESMAGFFRKAWMFPYFAKLFRVPLDLLATDIGYLVLVFRHEFRPEAGLLSCCWKM